MVLDCAYVPTLDLVSDETPFLKKKNLLVCWFLSDFSLVPAFLCSSVVNNSQSLRFDTGRLVLRCSSLQVPGRTRLIRLLSGMDYDLSSLRLLSTGLFLMLLVICD